MTIKDFITLYDGRLEQFQLVTDSQETAGIRKDTKTNYDSFFVCTCDGKIVEIYGFYGIVSFLDKDLFRVS